MQNNSDTIENFMGIFPNAASKEYCERVITRFDYMHESQSTGRGKVWSRQDAEGISSIEKENDTYFIGGGNGDDLPFKKEDTHLMMRDMPLLKEFNKIVWNCYNKYIKKYGTMTTLAQHRISPTIRIQKYKPSQGYHLWHCEAGDAFTGHRIIGTSLYLNTVKEGGETEFLYQGVRIPPVQGTLIMFPASWTHTHRGNPPLKENKYHMTTWLSFIE